MRAYCGFSGLRLRDQGGSSTAAGNGDLLDFGSLAEPTPPAGSEASSYWDCGTASEGIRVPFHDDSVVAAPKTPSGTNYIVQFRAKFLDPAGHPDTKIGVGPRNSVLPNLAVGSTATSNCLTLLIDDVVVDTSVVPFGVDTWRLVTIHRNGNDYNVYLDGDLNNPIITYNSGGSNPTGNIEAFHCRSRQFFEYRICDFIFNDLGGSEFPATLEEAIQASVGRLVLNGNGTHTAWSNGYTAVDERPSDDADYNEATATDQRQTYTVTTPTAAAIYGVCMYLRVTRHGTAAGDGIEPMSRKNGTDRDYGIKSAPGDGFVIVELGQTDAELNDWDVSNLGEFGFVSRTYV